MAVNFKDLGNSRKSDLFNSLKSQISNKRDKLIVDLLHETGITVNELVNLQVSHIKPNSIFIDENNTKNKQSRIIPIKTSISKKAKSFANPSQEYLFFSRQSPKITTRRVEQIFKTASKGLEIEIDPRDLRTWKLESLLRTEDLRTIKGIIGINSLKERQIPAKKDITKLEKRIKLVRDKVIFSIIKETSCNVSELINLKVKDIKKNFIILSTAKKKDTFRTIKISKELSNLISKISRDKSDDEYLFSTRQSSQMTARRIQQIFRNYSILAEVTSSISPRSLRNSSVLELTKKLTQNEVDELLQIKTSIYTHSQSFANPAKKIPQDTAKHRRSSKPT